MSGSFINVRAPNFLQPKTSLSSCRPLFELFSKKQHWLFFSEMISPQVTLRQSYPLIFMFTGSKISSVFCMEDIFVLLKMKIVFLQFILQIKCNSRSIQNLFYIGFRCSFIISSRDFGDKVVQMKGQANGQTHVICSEMITDDPGHALLPHGYVICSSPYVESVSSFLIIEHAII